MAVYFIENGFIDGAMVHRSDDRNVQVGILHNPSDGYKLGYDGQTIKEQLSVREFVKRVSVDRHGGPTGYYNIPHDKIEHDVQRILAILASRNETETLHLSQTLDKTYSNLIMRGKLQLAEHTISMRQKPAAYTTESVGSRERSVQQSADWNVKKVMQHFDEQRMILMQNPMTPDEAFRVSDEEVYYSIE